MHEEGPGLCSRPLSSMLAQPQWLGHSEGSSTGALSLCPTFVASLTHRYIKDNQKKENTPESKLIIVFGIN